LKPVIDKGRVSEVIRTDATVVNKTDFLATHTPFRKIHYGYGAVREIEDQNIRQADEETFFTEEILARRDSHQFIMVRGNTGSGKSHFIRWLKERYESTVDSATEEVMFIGRSQNTLQSALEQIINSGALKGSIATKDLGVLVEAKQHLSDRDLNKNIIIQFAAAADRAFEAGIYKGIDKRYARNVYAFLVDETVRNYLVAEGSVIERIAVRLNAGDSTLVQEESPRFLPEDFSDIGSILGGMDRNGAARGAIRLAENLAEEKEVREQVASFLNSHLETVVQECTRLQGGDLRRIFENLRTELKKAGKNLTLFIEDITSFVGIDRAFMEVLVTEHRGTEHNEKFCRILSVVGVTNDYFRTDLPDNLKERMTMVVYLDKATLTSENEVVEMVARYMNAIYLPQDVLSSWVEQGARGEDLPLFTLESPCLWASFKLEDGRELPIYPFNQRALMGMYNTLDTKTPRRLLQDIVAHTLKLYHAHRLGRSFPPAEKEMREGFSIPVLKEHTHESIIYRDAGVKADSLSILLRLWGDGTAFSRIANGERQLGGLTEDVFASFGLPFIKGIEESEIITTGSPPPPPPPPPPPGDKFGQMQRELANWTNGEPLMNLGKLREDLREIILSFIDWEMEGVSGAVASILVTDLSWFSIEDQRISYREEGYRVYRSKESQWALLALCGWRYKGDRSWNYNGASADLANLHLWLTKQKADIVSLLKSIPVQDGGSWDFPRWLLLADFYARAMCGQTVPSVMDTVGIYKWMFDSEFAVTVQENRSKEWRALQVVLSRRHQSVSDNHSMLTKYFNRKQVAIHQDTEVYFIDAAEPLRLIEELVASEWDLSCCNVKADENDGAIWFNAPKLMGVFRNGISAALDGEKQFVQDILADLKSYLKDPVDENEVLDLWGAMKTFLFDTLVKANEEYFVEELGLLQSKDAGKLFIFNVRGLGEYLKAKGIQKRLLYSAEHPGKHVIPYSTLLKKIESVVSQKTNKFTNKIANLSEGDGIVSLRKIAEAETDEILKLLETYTGEVGSSDA